MARGFESKDVEFQQAEAERTRTPRRALSAAEREMAEQRQGHELALARTRAELQAATNPRHIAMLERAIQALEDQLRDR